MVHHEGGLMKAYALLLSLALGTAMPALAAEFVLDDFEDGDRIARTSLAWIGLSDELTGEKSRVRLSIADIGAGAGGKKALRVEGELVDRFAGAWVALDAHGRAVDVSGFSAVRLRVRGPAELTVGLRGGMPFVNFTAPIQASDGWSELEVPFSALRPTGPNATGAAFEPKNVRWFGLSASPTRKGPFRFEVDWIAFVGAGTSRVAGLPTSGGPAMEASVARAQAPRGSEDWPLLTEDPGGDGKVPALPDARRVRGWRDPKTGVCWLRIELGGALEEDWVGTNVLLELDGDLKNGSEWWGVNKDLRFDRLVTAWVFATAAGYQGVVGVADAADVTRFEMMNPALGTPELAVDFGQGTILLGIPAAALGSGAASPRAVVAVGSSFAHNDDAPNAGSFALPR